jgi:CBS domain-containing protein
MVRLEAFCCEPLTPKVLADLQAGEIFPVESLEGNWPVFSTFRAMETTQCYCLSQKDFAEFRTIEKVFADFCVYKANSFKEQFCRIFQLHFTHQNDELQNINTPLSILMNPHPLTSKGGQAVRDLIALMNERNTDAAVIIDEQERPVGIFTLRDLMRKVIVPGKDTGMLVKDAMSPSVRTLPVSAMSFEASRLLAEEEFHHVVIVDDGRLAGIVKDQDLFRLHRINLGQLNAQIGKAFSIEDLKICHRDIRLLSENMLLQGMRADEMTRIISTLNDQVIIRTIELEFTSEMLEQFRICWITMGSEGRHEQTLSTDQDNGIIFKAADEMPPDRVREILLPLAGKVNHALAEVGFPLCKGNIMAMNPDCCLSYREWQNRFVKWITEPTPEALLYAAIFFDFRYVYGDAKLSDELRRWLVDAVRDGGRFCHLLSENALQFKPHLGLFRDFVLEDHPDCQRSIDIKANASNIFVDAARVYALAHGVTRSNTRKRLLIVGDHLKWAQSEVNAWVDAFSFLQSLRIRHHFELYRSGSEPHNRLNPYKLNNLDRKFFLESLKQAGKLQNQLRMDFGITSPM